MNKYLRYILIPIPVITTVILVSLIPSFIPMDYAGLVVILAIAQMIVIQNVLFPGFYKDYD